MAEKSMQPKQDPFVLNGAFLATCPWVKKTVYTCQYLPPLFPVRIRTSYNCTQSNSNNNYIGQFSDSARQGVVSSPQLPVMVYLHSGGYMIGSEQQAGPRRLMAKKNVVLVSLNYRLGVFGYLSTGIVSMIANWKSVHVLHKDT